MQTPCPVPGMLGSAVDHQCDDWYKFFVSGHSRKKFVRSDTQIMFLFVCQLSLFPLSLIAQALRQHISKNHMVIYKGLVFHSQDMKQPSLPHTRPVHDCPEILPRAGLLSQINKLRIRRFQFLGLYHLPSLKQSTVHLIGKSVIVIQIVKLIFIFFPHFTSLIMSNFLYMAAINA